VLVVDDHADAGETLALLLRRAGHEARAALDGSSALRTATQFLPEVVLLDIALPDMSGFDLARTLRRTPGLEAARLVALSGYAEDEHRRLAREAGCSDYFAKPLGIDALLDFLENPPLPDL
jgi:CheY-like chemotaxis protein